MSERLALFGGSKAIGDPLPSFMESRGRTFGQEEEELVLAQLPKVAEVVRRRRERPGRRLG